MRKKYLIVLALLLSCNLSANSQEASDLYNPTWEYYMKNYDNQQFTKPVTPQEFDKAIDSLKTYKKDPNKKSKSSF